MVVGGGIDQVTDQFFAVPLSGFQARRGVGVGEFAQDGRRSGDLVAKLISEGLQIRLRREAG